MKAGEMKEFIGAMEELEKERGIKKDYLLESLEAALVTAYKRNFDSVDNVKVTIDKDKFFADNQNFLQLCQLNSNSQQNEKKILPKHDIISDFLIFLPCSKCKNNRT